LALTHHDPLRSDRELARIIDDICSRQASSEPTLEIFGAAEGQELELCGTEFADQNSSS
jgi:hypothetical protein